MKKILKKILLNFNISVSKLHPERQYPIELEEDEKNFIEFISKNELSMCSKEKLVSTLLSCKNVVKNNISGDFVECGVWRGGNSLIAAFIFNKYQSNKKIYLFDTFEGMTPPTEDEFHLLSKKKSINTFQEYKNKSIQWCGASIDEVKKNFKNLNLLNENIIFIKGDVSQTLMKYNKNIQKISVLRLDTDFYESTKIELKYLYPKVETSGLIILDDYGHWSGSKKAVDEFFEVNNIHPFLIPIDYAARIMIK